MHCYKRVCEQIQRLTGLWYSAEYSTFSITDEVGKYRLTVDWYSGDAGNALMLTLYPRYAANGMMFSTPESDNDLWADGNCAGERGSGWWLGRCSTSNLNSDDSYGIWVTGTPVWNVQASRMLVKLN